MDLVFEIGCEELPASSQRPAVDFMATELRKELEAVNLAGVQGQKQIVVETYATPRRLALIATGLPERSPDVHRTVQGPPAKAAFGPDGKPTKAAEGFARKVGVQVSELKIDGDRVSVDQLVKGTSAVEALPGILSRIVAAIPFRKSMRWGSGDASFARPVHWIGATLDGKAVAVAFADVKSGTGSRGHRFESPDRFDLPLASQYVARLREAHVLADWKERRDAVWAEVQRAAREAGGEPLRDEELIDTVTGLVEKPTAIYGRFEPAYLELPPEVLVSEMRGHLKYFAVRDPASHKLLPAFVAVSNTKVVDPAVSRGGYERAIGPRLADGKFFFDEDRKSKLSDRNERLKRTVFLQNLGSQWDRLERIRELGLWLQAATGTSSVQEVNQAAPVLKSDLATGMVGEFPELQGVMGREYAKAEGLPATVADAIFEHYLPRGAEERLPQGDLGALLGIADRLDQLVGIFGIGKEPSGTADPYGLRRAAIGLIRLVLHKGFRIDVVEALRAAQQGFGKQQNKVDRSPQLVERIWQFLLGRLQSYWSEGYSTFEVQMAVGRASGNLLDLQARLNAIRTLRGSSELVEAAAAFKRIQNILQQAHDKGLVDMHFDPGALSAAAEKELAKSFERARHLVGESLKAGQYEAVFGQLAALRDPLARFFDDVMVMDPDAKVRDNRLALLRQLHELFAPLADFSRLQEIKA